MSGNMRLPASIEWSSKHAHYPLKGEKVGADSGGSNPFPPLDPEVDDRVRNVCDLFVVAPRHATPRFGSTLFTILPSPRGSVLANYAAGQLPRLIQYHRG